MIIDDAQLKWRHLQRISGVRDKKVYIGPEMVELQINNTCNLRCKYCWTHAPGNPAHFEKGNHFPWDSFVGIVRDCVELKVDKINICGSGEPTMHPAFRDMMRFMEDQPIFARLITNATFPLEYCSDVIRGDSVVIDLSAVNRQQYRDLQGKDLFDRVVANIKQLVYLRDTIKPDFYIEIGYIVNADNVDQTQQMRDFAAELRVNTLTFKKMNVHAYNRGIALPEDTNSEISGEDRRTPPECLHGWFYAIIKSGDIASLCCRIHQMHLGDFQEWSFKQLWLSRQFMNARILGKYGHLQKRYLACQTCPFYEVNLRRMQDVIELKENDKAIT